MNVHWLRKQADPEIEGFVVMVESVPQGRYRLHMSLMKWQEGLAVTHTGRLGGLEKARVFPTRLEAREWIGRFLSRKSAGERPLFDFTVCEVYRDGDIASGDIA